MLSDVRKKMHSGLAHWIDSPYELWHSHSWASSIRITSGEFAHYPDGEPIFPSDFVRFQCYKTLCMCNIGSCHNLHIGRVTSVGRDFRSAAVKTGAISLEIQYTIQASGTPSSERLESAPATNELFLTTDMIVLLEDKIVDRVISIHLDYTFCDEKLASACEHITQPEPATQHDFIIRRILENTPSDDGATSDFIYTPICHSSSWRA